jgi:uncharacterized protein YceK
MNKIILGLVLLVVSGCSPVSEYKSEPTKYPNAPTMQAAEDASKTKFDESSFDK